MFIFRQDIYAKNIIVVSEIEGIQCIWLDVEITEHEILRIRQPPQLSSLVTWRIGKEIFLIKVLKPSSFRVEGNTALQALILVAVEYMPCALWMYLPLEAANSCFLFLLTWTALGYIRSRLRLILIIIMLYTCIIFMLWFGAPQNMKLTILLLSFLFSWCEAIISP